MTGSTDRIILSELILDIIHIKILILLRFRVTVGVVWIGDLIYLQHTTRDYNQLQRHS
jgi:hypothetical protein